MKISLTEFVVKLYVIFGWMSNRVHEGSHLLTAKLLGHYAEINSDNIALTHITYNFPPPEWHRTIIFFSGGLGTFITFMVLSWRNSEPETKSSYRFAAIANLVYGFFEALYPSGFWEVGSLIGIFTAVTYFIYLILYKKPELVIW